MKTIILVFIPIFMMVNHGIAQTVDSEVSPAEIITKAKSYYTTATRAMVYAEYNTSLVYFDSAILLQPKNADYYLGRGEARQISKQNTGALADFEMALRLAPDHMAAKYRRANMYFVLGKYVEAVKDYTALLAIEEPSESNLLKFNGVAYNSSGPVKFAGISTLDHMTADILHGRALAYQKLAYVTPTMKDFDRAVLLNPKDASILVDRALYRIQQKNTEGAVTDLRKAISIEQYNKVALYNLSFYVSETEKDAIYKKLYGEGDAALAFSRRAFDSFQNGKYELALADYDSALMIKGDRAEDLMNRGVTKAKLERHQDAIRDYDNSIHVDNTLTRNLVLLGNSYTALGKYEEAIKYYKRFLISDGPDASVYYNIGVAAMKAEFNLQSCEAFTKALEMGETRASKAMTEVCE